MQNSIVHCMHDGLVIKTSMYVIYPVCVGPHIFINLQTNKEEISG